MCCEFENTVRNIGCQRSSYSLSAYRLSTVQVRIKPNANTSTDRHKASATVNEGTFCILSPIDIDSDSNGRVGSRSTWARETIEGVIDPSVQWRGTPNTKRDQLISLS
jgi:hypothetical protein